jgi:hypothetical protein
MPCTWAIESSYYKYDKMGTRAMDTRQNHWLESWGATTSVQSYYRVAEIPRIRPSISPNLRGLNTMAKRCTVSPTNSRICRFCTRGMDSSNIHFVSSSFLSVYVRAFLRGLSIWRLYGLVAFELSHINLT